MANFYVNNEYWFAAIQLILAMLGMGATLTGKDFRDVVLEPLAMSVGTAVQLVAVPLAAFTFLRLLGVQDGLAVGLALIAAIPGGTTSNIFTFFARGNAALSISITAVTTLLCLISTPLILSLMISQYLPADFSMPKAQIMREIALTLLLPLAIGMIYLYLYPRSAPTLSKWSIRGSLIGILLIVIGSAAAGRLNIAAFGTSNVLMVVAFVILLSAVGHLVPRLLRLSRTDSTAIEFEVIVRNINLGVMIKASIFPAAAVATAELGNTVLFTLLLYGALQLLIAAVLIPICRRSNSVSATVPSNSTK
ncbi:MAG: bile acid:sodium symporter family protein [Halioglobus sp.]